MKNKWMYDIYNNQVWDSCEFDTKDECIMRGKAEVLSANKNRDKYGVNPIDSFRIGRLKNMSLDDVNIYIDVDEVLRCVAKDTVGRIRDIAFNGTFDINDEEDDYLYDLKDLHKEELGTRLNKIVLNWIKEHNHTPDLFKIINIEDIDY